MRKESMRFSNEYTVVLTVQSEKDLTRIKILGHNRDISLVDSWLRSRIAGLEILSEEIIGMMYEEKRSMTAEHITIKLKN